MGGNGSKANASKAKAPVAVTHDDIAALDAGLAAQLAALDGEGLEDEVPDADLLNAQAVKLASAIHAQAAKEADVPDEDVQIDDDELEELEGELALLQAEQDGISVADAAIANLEEVAQKVPTAAEAAPEAEGAAGPEPAAAPAAVAVLATS